jgi:hypothetical protein
MPFPSSFIFAVALPSCVFCINYVLWVPLPAPFIQQVFVEHSGAQGKAESVVFAGIDYLW